MNALCCDVFHFARCDVIGVANTCPCTLLVAPGVYCTLYSLHYTLHHVPRTLYVHCNYSFRCCHRAHLLLMECPCKWRHSGKEETKLIVSFFLAIGSGLMQGFTSSITGLLFDETVKRAQLAAAEGRPIPLILFHLLFHHLSVAIVEMAFVEDSPPLAP